MKTIFTIWKKPKIKIYKTKKIEGRHPLEDIFQSQSIISGFDQAMLGKTSINLIGAGGLGSEIGMALIRKGIGELNIYDNDVVNLSNLSRQHFFKKDLYKQKAPSLARNLSKMATNNSLIRGIPFLVQDAVEQGIYQKANIIVVAVDNNEARFYCSKVFYDLPVIFTAVSREADSGWVFVQEPEKACFGCEFYDWYGKPTPKCTGSTIDINKVMGGMVSYVVDSLIMNRDRDWNHKTIHFTGPIKDVAQKISRNKCCRFCSS